MFRIVYIFFILIKYIFILLLVRLNLYKVADKKILRGFFEEAGGTFIKLGQILALRIDVLPKQYALELIDLFDQFKSFPYDEVERIFMQELGASPEKIFKVFEKTPFASASFAQVHAARLSKNEVVVVKIQRPGILQDVMADFFIISILAFIADLFFKIEALPWKEFANEFKSWTKKELDYHIEAENMQRIYNSVATNKVTHIVIPKTYHRLTTKKIIVQEYLDGIPLSNVLREFRKGKLDGQKMDKMGINMKKVSRTMITEILREYFMDGFFHADPHPGNILLLENGKIGFIDFGIVGQSAPKRAEFMQFLYTGALSQDDKQELKKIGYYFLRFAGDTIEQTIGSAFAANIDQKHIDGFMQLLAQHFYEYIKNVEMKIRKDLLDMKTDYTTMVLQMLKFVHRYQIQLPKQMIVFIRTLSIIGFLTHEMDPDFNMSSIVVEFCNKNPVESIPKLDSVVIPYKRLSREQAIEKLNNWMSYLIERDPKLYKIVNNYVSKYGLD